MLAQLQTYESSYGMPYAFAFCTNLYGPHDRFNTETGHVIPSLVKKFHDARQAKTAVTVWGDGSAHRDFLYIKDCPPRASPRSWITLRAPSIWLQERHEKIRDVVNILAAHTGMKNKSSGTPASPSGYIFRTYDVSRLRTAGFTCHYTLEQALHETYDWYAGHSGTVRQ